jgi:hypothetical protein
MPSTSEVSQKIATIRGQSLRSEVPGIGAA